MKMPFLRKSISNIANINKGHFLAPTSTFVTLVLLYLGCFINIGYTFLLPPYAAVDKRLDFWQPIKELVYFCLHPLSSPATSDHCLPSGLGLSGTGLPPTPESHFLPSTQHFHLSRLQTLEGREGDKFSFS